MSYKFHVAQTCAYIMQACVGLPTSPAEPPDLSGVPPETVPSGDFKVSSNPTSQLIPAPQKPWLYGAIAWLSSMVRITAGRPDHKAHAAAAHDDAAALLLLCSCSALAMCAPAHYLMTPGLLSQVAPGMEHRVSSCVFLPPCSTYA